MGRGEHLREDNLLPQAQQPAERYVRYLAERLAADRPHLLRHAYEWFLIDAVGVEEPELSERERATVAWLAAWDDPTVQGVGDLLNRARAEGWRAGCAHAAERPA